VMLVIKAVVIIVSPREWSPRLLDTRRRILEERRADCSTRRLGAPPQALHAWDRVAATAGVLPSMAGRESPSGSRGAPGLRARHDTHGRRRSCPHGQPAPRHLSDFSERLELGDRGGEDRGLCGGDRTNSQTVPAVLAKRRRTDPRSVNARGPRAEVAAPDLARRRQHAHRSNGHPWHVGEGVRWTPRRGGSWKAS